MPGKGRKSQKGKKQKRVKTETTAQLTKEVKQIKKQLYLTKPEVKHLTAVFGGGSFKFAEYDSLSGDTACKAFTIDYPKQGSGVGLRDGDRILIKSLEFKMTLNTAAITQDIDYTIYLLRWNNYTPNVSVSNADILTFLNKDVITPATGVGISNRSYPNMERGADWVVLKKKKGTMKQMSAMNSPNQYFQNVSKTFIMKYSKPHYLEYIEDGAGDATQISKGAHVLLFLAGNASDAHVAGQVIDVNDCSYRITYTDA